jgi:hypothetical protein
MTEAANAPAGEGTTAAAPVEGATAETTAAAAAPVKTEATTAAPPPGDKGTRETIAAGGTEDKPAAAPADWPENWRDLMAESARPGDKKFRERLDRFNAPTEVTKSWLAAESKISAGETKKALPEGATADEVAAWKKEQGLPLEAKDYIEKMELPKGVVFGEAEKPLVNSFAEAALKNNWDQNTYNGAVKWWTEQQAQIQAAREAADDDFHQKSDDALRSEWGADYRKNVNAIGNILSTLPEEMHIRDGNRTEVGGVLLAARLPNGRLLGDHPVFVKWLANQARELNPTATLLPAGTGDPTGSIDTEIQNIEKLMKDRTSDYWRGPKSGEMQQRYRDLLDGRERMKSRSAA